MRGVAAFPGVAAGRLGHREAGRYARTMAETPTGPGSGPASSFPPTAIAPVNTDVDSAIRRPLRR